MNDEHYEIPEKLNIFLLFALPSICFLLLYFVSHSSNYFYIAIAAFLFSLFNNSNFALLHEAVHGVFSKNKKLNYFAGLVLAATFPTCFTIQKVSHIGHHNRNRTDVELYDYYLPNESKWLKTYWLYCLLFGFYWSIIPIANFVYFLIPGIFNTKAFQEGPARFWGFEPFVKDISQHSKKQIWLEILFTIFFQASMWYLLDLNVLGYFICYWIFAINWSAMQYVTHAWTKRDVKNGAWNLKMNWLISKIYLHYNFHLEHHRKPSIPWLYLPKLVNKEEYRPHYFEIYFSLWGGARKAPIGDGPKPLTYEKK